MNAACSSEARPRKAVKDRDAPAPCLACGALETFERQVLVFPLLVIVLACASFLFGGRCAAWQWWTAVAAVVSVPFTRRSQWHTALLAAGLFTLLLFALRCLIPPLVWDSMECDDMSSYHLPTAQLLIEGWNPVQDPQAENILSSLGLDRWGMSPLHVVFLPKATAVFSAVAYRFIKDPYALFFPGLAFLWLGLLLASVRLFSGFPRGALVAALVFVLPEVAWRMPVDLSVAFAAFGLLLAMQDALRRKSCDWLSLAVWAAWMMNVKHNGVIGAFVFCSLFVMVKTWNERLEWKNWIVRFAAFGTALVLFWCLISWNPLGTSWRTYGHPLYPFKTFDAERFPIRDLTWDLKVGNEDLKCMGRTARFAHAYLSPKATVFFLRWRFHQNDFNPSCIWWSRKEFPSCRARIQIWLLFAVLFLLPGGRIWGIGGLLLLFSVPTHVIGYTRYQPWLSSLGCLAVALLAEWADSRLQPRLSKALESAFMVVLCFSSVCWVFERTKDVECKAIERSTVREVIRARFMLPHPEVRRQAPFIPGFVPRTVYLTYLENRCRLMVRELGRSDQTEVVPAIRQSRISKGSRALMDERTWLCGLNPSPDDGNNQNAVPPSDEKLPDEAKDAQYSEEWLMTPFGYWVPANDQARHMFFYNGLDDSDPENDKSIGLFQQVREFFHIWFSIYPKDVLSRMKNSR